MILNYLVGLGVILGLIAYPIIFNTTCHKFTGEDMMDNNAGIFGYIFAPYLFAMAFLMILMLPLIIGKIIMS